MEEEANELYRRHKVTGQARDEGVGTWRAAKHGHAFNRTNVDNDNTATLTCLSKS